MQILPVKTLSTDLEGKTRNYEKISKQGIVAKQVLISKRMLFDRGPEHSVKLYLLKMGPRHLPSRHKIV